VILSFQDVFHPFLDFVHAFGIKTSDDENIWEGYQAYISDISQSDGGASHYREHSPCCHSRMRVEVTGRVLLQFAICGEE
jgi:hypothetical protein